MGLVAARRLAARGHAGLAAVKDRMRQVQILGNTRDIDIRDDEWALLALYDRCGEEGLKEKVRWEPYPGRHDQGGEVGVTDAPSVDAPDEQWVTFLRDDKHGFAERMLLWSLSRDTDVLADLCAELEQHRRYEVEHDIDEFKPPGQWIREILFLAPPTHGIEDEVLRSWSEAGGSPGFRWGADLALARRGDKAAFERLLRAIDERFPLMAVEAQALDGREKFVCDSGEFELVVELAALSPQQTAPVLLNLLLDVKGDLLASQAAAVLALAEHWDTLMPAQRDRVREVMGEVLRGDRNEWLQSLVIEFMVAHPRQ